MTPHIIRAAEVGDIPALIDIESTCFDSDKISKRQMHYLIVHGKTLWLVACEKKNNQLLGYGLCLLSNQHKTARLYSLAVLPKYRGAHIASDLLTDLILKLRALSYQYCHLEVRTNDLKTQSLYRKYGFMNLKYLANYYQDGEDAVRMRLVLANKVSPPPHTKKPGSDSCDSDRMDIPN